MSPSIPMLHGSVGWLDELLTVGILLVFGIVIFFLTVLFGKKSNH